MTDQQKANLDTLIAHLEKLPEEQFDMDIWQDEYAGHGCGTVACIGGWCEKLFHAQPGFYGVGEVDSDDFDTAAGRSIGLDEFAAERLFYAGDKHDAEETYGDYVLGSITKDMALLALKRIRETGTFTHWGDFGAEALE